MDAVHTPEFLDAFRSKMLGQVINALLHQINILFKDLKLSTNRSFCPSTKGLSAVSATALRTGCFVTGIVLLMVFPFCSPIFQCSVIIYSLAGLGTERNRKTIGFIIEKFAVAYF